MGSISAIHAPFGCGLKIQRMKVAKTASSASTQDKIAAKRPGARPRNTRTAAGNKHSANGENNSRLLLRHIAQWSVNNQPSSSTQPKMPHYSQVMPSSVPKSLR